GDGTNSSLFPEVRPRPALVALDQGGSRMDLQGLDRRQFIRVSGTAALATAGIEGILSARRAPAWAQGTKLHIVRWVDFIPEADVELKRQPPAAPKARGGRG